MMMKIMVMRRKRRKINTKIPESKRNDESVTHTKTHTFTHTPTPTR